MKKLFILAAFAMTFIGCEKVSPMESDVTINSSLKPSFYYIDDGVILNHMYYVCDRKTNNVYLYHSSGNRAALSIYYDANGNIVKCNEVK